MADQPVLSGEGLLRAKLAKSQPKVLPVTGQKFSGANGSWLEKSQVELLLDEQHDWIAEEKAEKRSQLSEAVWHKDHHLAEVTKQVGSCWQTFGFQEGQTVYLQPEEALFLVETTCLELEYGGVPVSIQQGYSLLFRNQEELQNYRVYRELMQIGYRARRSKDLKIPGLETNSKPESDGNGNEASAEGGEARLSVKDTVTQPRPEAFENVAQSNPAAVGPVSATSEGIGTLTILNDIDSVPTTPPECSNASDIPMLSSTVKDTASVIEACPLSTNISPADSTDLLSADTLDTLAEANQANSLDNGVYSTSEKFDNELASSGGSEFPQGTENHFNTPSKRIVADNSSPKQNDDEPSAKKSKPSPSSSDVTSAIETPGTCSKRAVAVEAEKEGEPFAKKNRIANIFSSASDFAVESDDIEFVDNVYRDTPASPTGVGKSVVDRVDSGQMRGSVKTPTDPPVRGTDRCRIDSGDIVCVDTVTVTPEDKLGSIKERAKLVVSDTSTNTEPSKRTKADSPVIGQNVLDFNSSGNDKSISAAENVPSKDLLSGNSQNRTRGGSDSSSLVPLNVAELTPVTSSISVSLASVPPRRHANTIQSPGSGSDSSTSQSLDSDDDVILLSDSDDEAKAAPVKIVPTPVRPIPTHMFGQHRFPNITLTRVDKSVIQPKAESLLPACTITRIPRVAGNSKDLEHEVFDVEGETDSPSSPPPGGFISKPGRQIPTIVSGEATVDLRIPNELDHRIPKVIPTETPAHLAWRIGQKKGFGLKSALSVCKGSKASAFIPFGSATKDWSSNDDDVVLLSEPDESDSESDIVVLSDDDEPPKINDQPESSPNPARTSPDSTEIQLRKIDGTSSAADPDQSSGAVEDHTNPVPSRPDSAGTSASVIPKTEPTVSIPRPKNYRKHPSESEETSTVVELDQPSDATENVQPEVPRGMFVPSGVVPYRWDPSILWNNVPEELKEEAEALKRMRRRLKTMPPSPKRAELLVKYEPRVYVFSKKVYDNYIEKRDSKLGIIREEARPKTVTLPPTTLDDSTDSESDTNLPETLEEIIDITAGDDERDRLLAMVPNIFGVGKVIVPIPSSQFLPRNVDPPYPFYTWENGKCTPSILVDRLNQPNDKKPLHTSDANSTATSTSNRRHDRHDSGNPVSGANAVPFPNRSKFGFDRPGYNRCPDTRPERADYSNYIRNRQERADRYSYSHGRDDTPERADRCDDNRDPNTRAERAVDSGLQSGYTVYSSSFSNRRYGINPWTDNRWGAFQLHVFGRGTPLGFMNFGPNHVPTPPQLERFRTGNHRPFGRGRRRSAPYSERRQPLTVSPTIEPSPDRPLLAVENGSAEKLPLVKEELVDPGESAIPKVRGITNVISWKEFKEKVVPIAKVKKEPEGLVTPVVATSLGSVYKRLSIIRNVGKPTMNGVSSNPVKPVFDLFSPDVRYRKSRPDPPNFRLAISRGVNLPSGTDLQPLFSSCGETSRAVLAVPLSSVLYFEVAQIEIPNLNNEKT